MQSNSYQVRNKLSLKNEDIRENSVGLSQKCFFGVVPFSGENVNLIQITYIEQFLHIQHLPNGCCCHIKCRRLQFRKWLVNKALALDLKEFSNLDFMITIVGLMYDLKQRGRRISSCVFVFFDLILALSLSLCRLCLFSQNLCGFPPGIQLFI